MSDIPEEWYGHTPVVKVITTYRCEKCDRELTAQGGGTFTHEPRTGHYVSDWDSNKYRKEQEKKAAQQRVGTAREYHGAIKQCQVGLTTRDRASIHYRCERNARFVSRDTHGKPMVVCGLHIKEDRPYRYMGKDWPKTPGAVEPIEPEYL